MDEYMKDGSTYWLFEIFHEANKYLNVYIVCVYRGQKIMDQRYELVSE